MSALNKIRLPEPTPVRYVIDAGLSRFTVRVLATGFLSAFGHSPTIAIRDFEGEIQFSSDSLAEATLHLDIVAASLSVQNAISDEDRREIERVMREEVLEVSRFPHITYDCSRVSGSLEHAVVLNGELSLHGVTRIQPVEARVSVVGNMLRASGELGLRQTEYGIKPVSTLGGALKVKDDVKLAFDLAARKQTAE